MTPEQFLYISLEDEAIIRKGLDDIKQIFKKDYNNGDINAL